MDPNDHIPRDERVRRIGELLAKGVALLLLNEKRQPNSAGERPDRPLEPSVRDQAATCANGEAKDIDGELIRYLSRVESASPRQIQVALEMSKPTAFRKLAILVSAGIAMRSGRTTGVRYRLVNPEIDRQMNTDGLCRKGQ